VRARENETQTEKVQKRKRASKTDRQRDLAFASGTHDAAHCSTLQHTATLYSTHSYPLQHSAVHFNTHRQICSTLQHTAARCNTLQHTVASGMEVHQILVEAMIRFATRYNALQHTATHCNTLLPVAWRYIKSSSRQ